MPITLCVKCSLNLFHLKKYSLSEKCEESLELIRQWTGRNVTNKDYMCSSCWVLASRSKNEGQASTSVHTSQYICIICGKSTRRCKKRIIKRPENTKCDERIVTVFEKWVEPRKISLTDEVCRACWQRASRAADRYIPKSEIQFELAIVQDAALQDDSMTEVKKEALEDNDQDQEIQLLDVKEHLMQTIPHDDELSNIIKAADPDVLYTNAGSFIKRKRQFIDEKKEPIPQPIEESDFTMIEVNQDKAKSAKLKRKSINVKKEKPKQPLVEESSLTTIQAIAQTAKPEKNYIILPNIKRASVSSHCCLFFKCKEPEKYHIPSAIRQRVLKDYNYYIPVNTRICKYHMQNNLYHELYGANNAHSHFDAAQIEEMVFLASEVTSINFQSLDSIQENLFQYCLGFTYSEYEQIIQHFPQLNSKKHKCGLIALLCKLRTGDSNERIANLFKMPRRTLEGYMKDVKTILKDVDFLSYIESNTVEKTTQLDENTGKLKKKNCSTTKWSTLHSLIKAVTKNK